MAGFLHPARHRVCFAADQDRLQLPFSEISFPVFLHLPLHSPYVLDMKLALGYAIGLTHDWRQYSRSGTALAVTFQHV